MKKLTIILLLLLALQAKSQIVTFAGSVGGWITEEELLSTKELEIKDLILGEYKGEILGFSISAEINGFIEQQNSNSAQIRPAQQQLLKNVLPGNRIFIEDIKVKYNGEVVRANVIVLRKDGPIAVFSDLSSYLNVSKLMQNPIIYIIPNHLSQDTANYTVTSFKIKSLQPDYYYILESNSNKLSPEMIDFAKNAIYDFNISEIIATDNNHFYKEKFKIKLADITIETQNTKIFRQKSQLLKAAEIDFIAPISDLKVTSFELYKKTKSGNENDDVITATGNIINIEMKKYINNLNIGQEIEFKLNCINQKGEKQEIYLSVRIF